MRSSIASSTLALRESSLASSSSSCAGDSSSNMPVILLANACGDKHSWSSSSQGDITNPSPPEYITECKLLSRLSCANQVLCKSVISLPVALREHVGRVFPPGLVCVQAEDQAHHWGCPLMKAWKVSCLWTAASVSPYETSRQVDLTQHTHTRFWSSIEVKCVKTKPYLSRSLRDPARSPPLLLSLSRSLFLRRCIRST